MKKLIMTLISVMFIFTPSYVSARVETRNLEELIEYKIETYEVRSGYDSEVEALEEADLSNYEDGEGKVNIYFFESPDCGYCLDLTVYLASIIPDYGHKINIISYETTNSDNVELLDKVKAFFEEESDGVPYMVIGDQPFLGYNSSQNEYILDEIDKQYNSSSPYDVMEEMNIKVEADSGSLSMFWIIAIQLLSTGALAGFIFYKFDKLEKKIDSIKRK